MVAFRGWPSGRWAAVVVVCGPDGEIGLGRAKRGACASLATGAPLEPLAEVKAGVTAGSRLSARSAKLSGADLAQAAWLASRKARVVSRQISQ